MKIMLVAIGVSAAVGILVMQSGRATNATVIRSAMGTLWEPGERDSWFFIDSATSRLHEAPGQPLYEELFFHRKEKFQYPVTSLLGWDLLRHVTNLRTEDVFRLANALSFPLIGLCGLFSALILRNSWTRTHGRAPTETRLGTFLFLAGGIALAFLFFPLTKSWRLGQIQTALSLFAIGSILAWQTGHKRLSGVLIGLCCVFKPQWCVALVWALFRRENRVAWSGVMVCVTVVLIGGVVYGFNQYPDYLSTLSFLSRHGESYQPNQSVNGLMHRFLGNGDPLHFQRHEFPPYHAAVHLATVVSGIALLGALFVWGRHRKPQSSDLAVVFLALTIASPIAWEHHYGILIGVVAAWLPGLLQTRPLGNATPWILSFLWILVGQNFPFLSRFAGMPIPSLLLSHVFLGALTFLVLAMAFLPASSGEPERQPA